MQPAGLPRSRSRGRRHRSVGSLVHVPEGALAVPGRGDDRLDVIALAGTEAREHAEKTAITDVGPAAVDTTPVRCIGKWRQ
jgi:hypothetical protein